MQAFVQNPLHRRRVCELFLKSAAQALKICCTGVVFASFRSKSHAQAFKIRYTGFVSASFRSKKLEPLTTRNHCLAVPSIRLCLSFLRNHSTASNSTLCGFTGDSQKRSKTLCRRCSQTLLLRDASTQQNARKRCAGAVRTHRSDDFATCYGTTDRSKARYNNVQRSGSRKLRPRPLTHSTEQAP